MNAAGVEVSVVLPAYNEAGSIEGTVRAALDALDAFLDDGTYEVIVAEDGCTDRTPEIAERLAAEVPAVRHVHSEERLGRGGALNRAFAAADGDVLVYFDTDLATDLGHLEELVESVRSGESDVATGSRWMPGREAVRPTRRAVPSRGFNVLVRTLLGSSVRDHQAGFKAFSREAFETLRPGVRDEHWFWDTEMLVRAQRHGFRVREFPIEWEAKGDSKVDLVRDVFGMGTQVLRTAWEFNVSPYANRRTGMVAGFALSVVALGLMFLYLDPRTVVATMARADPVMLLAGAAVFSLSWPIRGHRYGDILDRLGYEEGTAFLTGAVFISQTGNLVFPARAGDAIRAYVMKARRGLPYTSGFASMTIERVFDLLTITGLAGAMLVALIVFAPGQYLQLVDTLFAGEQITAAQQRSARVAVGLAVLVGLAAIGAVALILVTARSPRNRVRPLVEWASDDSYVEYVAGKLEQFVGDIQTVANDRGAFARIGIASVFVWSLDALPAAFVFRAMGVDLPLPLLLIVSFFAVSVGDLAKVLPLSPAGIGLYEAAFTVLTVAITPVAPATAFAVSIVDHGLKHFVTLAGGLTSMTLLNISLTEAVEGVEAEPNPRPADE